MTEVKRAVLLKGKEVVTVMSLCLSLKQMTPEEQSQFIKVVWVDWRTEDESCADVMNGVAVFFDLWFSLDRDYQKIFDAISYGTHPSFREDAIKEAKEMADRNVAAVRQFGKRVETTFETFPMTDNDGKPSAFMMMPPTKEAN